jgi:two-component system, NtrC family, sensor kinase
MPIVLIIDDESKRRYAMARALRTGSFDVRESINGADGLLAARQAPDAIILDVKLPDLDGFEVCRRLKADPATSAIPVILKSAYLDESAHGAAQVAGADEFIIDSGDSTLFLNAVTRLIAP